jgi:tetratricopeptide (TPR) repeat protein
MKMLVFVGLSLIASSCYASDQELAAILDGAIGGNSDCEELFHQYSLSDSVDCFNASYESSEHDLVKSVARHGSSLAYQRMGEHQKALDDMQEAIRLAHSYKEAVLYMARLLAGYSRLLLFHDQRDLADRYLKNSRDYYETYIKVMGSDHPETGFLAYQVSASLYLEAGDFSEARAYARKALNKAALMPEVVPSTTHLLLAKLEAAVQRPDEARVAAWRACRSDGNEPAVVEGCILAARGAKEEGNENCASRALSRALEKSESAKWEDADLAMEIESLIREIGNAN